MLKKLYYKYWVLPKVMQAHEQALLGWRRAKQRKQTQLQNHFMQKSYKLRLGIWHIKYYIGGQRDDYVIERINETIIFLKGN